jgi:DNA repair protein RecN (Recombination protein N)
MADSVFEVGVDPAPLGAFGADKVELRIAPSAKLAPRPVAQVASGGELSRIALALHVATGEGEAPTMVFDEIDAGVGGHTAHAIAGLLKRLAEHAQVICITHLPQVAARADEHVVITKHAGSATLETLASEDEVLDELQRMLGADADHDAARELARQLRGPRFLVGGQPAAAPVRSASDG